MLEVHPELRPMLDCPRYDGCSAPLCPLDPKLPQRDGRINGRRTGGVREPACQLPKAERLQLGKSLPWRGLWPRELAGVKQWEDEMPEQQKAPTGNLNGGENAR